MASRGELRRKCEGGEGNHSTPLRSGNRSSLLHGRSLPACRRHLPGARIVERSRTKFLLSHSAVAKVYPPPRPSAALGRSRATHSATTPPKQGAHPNARCDQTDFIHQTGLSLLR